jgi:hypothetical protein
MREIAKGSLAAPGCSERQGVGITEFFVWIGHVSSRRRAAMLYGMAKS